MAARTLLVAALLAGVAVAAVAAVRPHNAHGFKHLGESVAPSAELFESWLAASGISLRGNEQVPEMRQHIIRRVLDMAIDQIAGDELRPAAFKHFEKYLSQNPSEAELRALLRNVIESEEPTAVELDEEGNYKSVSDASYPYFGFIPPYKFSLIPDGAAVSWSTSCWQSNTAKASTNADGSVTITFTTSGQLQFLCSDHFLVMTVAAMKWGVGLTTAGTSTLMWNTTGLSTSEKWDLATKGIRFFQFTDPVLTTWLEIFDTALLFVPMLSQNVSTAAGARNVQFLADYAHITMNNRTAGLVNIDPSTVQSGDFFGVIRLDGLDPMLAWAMGSTTGHTTVALWDDDGQLYIHESTANDSYWPTNGIQRTPWAQWIKQANEASYNVVHAPLSKAVAAKFNRTAALEWFATVEGLNYGYHNMLWGWIDTVSDNYPCTPPDFSSKCLQWELVETLFAVLDKLIPSLGDLFFVQAWNLRLGTQNLPPADLYMFPTRRASTAASFPPSWNRTPGTTRPCATASRPSASPWCAASSCAVSGRLVACSVTMRRTAPSSPTGMTTPPTSLMRLVSALPLA